MSLRDQIRAAKDIEHQLVEVPEWDVVVEMRTPTVRARGEMISEFMKDNGTIDYVRMYPSLVIACAYDPETGDKAFTLEDLDWLAEKSAKALERLGEVAVELSGMEKAAERLDAGKDASTPTPNSRTPSG